MAAAGQISPAPLVSVILPTFNRLQYLQPAVESVFAQTLTDWEMIIADDGSDAETRAYLSTLENPPRIRVIWLPHSGNYSRVRNAALREARGEYVAFLDSDDLWLPEKLALQLEALRSSATRRWSYTGHCCIDSEGHEKTLSAVPRWVPYAGAISEQILRDQALITTPSVVAARDLVMRAGGFDEQQTLFEDFDLWLRLLTLSEVDVIDMPLLCVRKHEANTGRGGIDLLAARERMLRKVNASVTDPGLRKTIERLRAMNAGTLAIAYAGTERLLALRTLVDSSRCSWRYARWWLRTLRVLVKVTLPRRLLTIYRVRRLRHHRDPAIERG